MEWPPSSTLRFTASSVSNAGTTWPAGMIWNLSEPAVSLSTRSARNCRLSHAVTAVGQVAWMLSVLAAGCWADAIPVASVMANAAANLWIIGLLLVDDSTPSAAHFDAGPRFAHLHHLREVRVLAHQGERDGEHLANRRAHHHGRAEVLGLIHAQAHVLVGERRLEADVERARQHAARELVGRGGVAPGAGVDHVDHHLRVEPGLHAHHHRLGSHRHRGGRQDVVRELHGLRLAGLLAEEEGL